MPILDENETRIALKKALESSANNLIIFSAFIKLNAFEWVVNQVKNRNINVKIIARWDVNDLLSGVSDLKVYERCKELNWEFRVNSALHSKLYLIDSYIGYLGSNNLTGAGLGLHSNNNIEFSTEIRPDTDDLRKIQKYISSSPLMDDELYEQIQVFVEKNTINTTRVKWPNLIMDKLKINPEFLWVDSFPLSNPFKNDFKNEYKRDEKLFGNIDINNKKDLKDAFLNLHVTNWIVEHLQKTDEKQFYFGELSVLIHNSLLNDPKPYRKEIKDLIANFYAWVKFLELTELKVEQPNHSEVLKLSS